MKPGERFMMWMLPLTLNGTNSRIHRLCHTNIEFLYDPEEGDGEFVDINSLVAVQQGKGYGTQALRIITGMADTFGVKLNLFARAMDHKPHSTKRLIEWYERHGFVAPTDWRPYGDPDPDEEDEGHHGLDLFRAPQAQAYCMPSNTHLEESHGQR